MLSIADLLSELQDHFERRVMKIFSGYSELSPLVKTTLSFQVEGVPDTAQHDLIQSSIWSFLP
jgi:hypothetical protein